MNIAIYHIYWIFRLPYIIISVTEIPVRGYWDMRRNEFETIEKYMLECMNDSSHDPEHVMRVLYTAMHIAETEGGADQDILIASCLLHDIGRGAQFKDPSICHAAEGGKMAERFLIGIGWSAQRAKHVSDCVRTHRWRSGDPPESVEAKILFDADKLEAAGALGIARTLMYQGQVGQQLYTMRGREVCSGTDKDAPESFYKEYHCKLKNIYSMFYTSEARRMAETRKDTAAMFMSGLESEINSAYANRQALDNCLSD